MECAHLILILVFAASPANSQGPGVDLTLQPETSGPDVVFTSVGRIRASGIFPDDNRLLRRIAYVETRDGVDLNTYRAGYNGGIWQVDEDIFNQTQDTNANPQLLGFFEGLRNAFGPEIDWPNATWVDLRKPFFSAIAARLYFETIGEAIPPVGNILGQGEYWVEYYSNDPEDSAERFVQFVNDFESEECPSRGIDLVFVLDSSGSVGERNFDLTKEFAADVTSVFRIGPQETQVAAIAFSGFANISFFLNNHTNQSELLEAISDIRFFDIPGMGRPSTNTADALTTLRLDVLTTEAGARPPALAIPRVAIVVTDGQSNINRSQTIPAAEALHAAGIIVFAVGVGRRVNMDELMAIGSSPNFVSLLSDFNLQEFQGLQRILSIETCVVPAPVDIEQTIIDTLDEGEIGFFQFRLPTQGMTIRLQVQQGRAVLYASASFERPSAAFYDYILETDSTEDVYIDPSVFGIETPDVGSDMSKRQVDFGGANSFTNTTIFVSVEGIEETNSIQMETEFGDTSTPSSEGGLRTALSWLFLVVLLGMMHMLL